MMTELSPDSIKAQLERILTSSDFMAGKRLRQLLRYVVEQSQNGQTDSIKQYQIAVEALDYGADFNPQTNPTVRILAQRVRRALDQYYLNQGINDPIRIEIPKGGYVSIFRHRTAAYFSSSEAFGTNTMPHSLTSHRSRPNLAVSALSNLCQEESWIYLADGLTEEILIALTRYSDLPVMGPLSKERLKQEQLGPRKIGARYGVRFLLDGSVRCQKGKILVGVRLTDTTTGAHVWAETYKPRVDHNDLFDIEQDISLKVLGATTDVHGIIHRTMARELYGVPPGNYSVHQAMLKFYHYLRTGSVDRYKDATTALENALALAPDSALATAALGGMHADEFVIFGGSRVHLEKALNLIENAYRLNPNDYVVQFIRAYVYFYARSADRFMAALELAVHTNPHISTNGELALYCAYAQHADRAVVLFEQARQLNPHIPGYYHLTPFMAHAYQGEYEQALANAQEIRIPALFMDPIARAVALGHLGCQKEAAKVVAELLQLVPDFEETGREMIQRIWRYEQPVTLLIEGLRKAGMENL